MGTIVNRLIFKVSILLGLLQIIKGNDKVECGDLSLTTPGFLKTPGFPENCVSNLNCTWKITSKVGTRIQFSVQGIIPSEECSDVYIKESSDFLQWTNVSSCHSYWYVIYSKTNILWINFYHENSCQGFYAKFRSKDNTGSTTSGGSVSSTHYTTIQSTIQPKKEASEGISVWVILVISLAVPFVSLYVIVACALCINKKWKKSNCRKRLRSNTVHPA